MCSDDLLNQIASEMDGSSLCLRCLIKAFTLYHVISCLTASNSLSGTKASRKINKWSSQRSLRAAVDYPNPSRDFNSKDALEILDIVESLKPRSETCTKATTLHLQIKDLPGSGNRFFEIHELAAIK